MPISAIDAISPAFEHTKLTLLKPFRMAQWAKLALVGFLAGELSSGGCSSPNFSGFQNPGHGPQHFPTPSLPHIDMALVATLVTVFAIVGLLLWVLFIYLNSMMRFVLFDSVMARHCEIRASWSRRQSAGWQLFIWQLLLAFVSLGTIAVLGGVPLLIAFALGWFKQPKDHLAPLILGGILLFLAFFALTLILLIIHLCTKDFVVPQMALEDLSAFEAWRRLLGQLQADKFGFAGYVAMKIVLAITAAIVFGIAGVIMVLILLIPVGGLSAVALVVAGAAGVGWNLYTITAAVVAGMIFLFVMLYLMSLVSVPGIVFFPAYSIYFFAARYPKLQMVLYPPAPASIVPPALPSQPWTSNPEPIG